jgi:quercetin dioxygenase-like cupin family protein
VARVTASRFFGVGDAASMASGTPRPGTQSRSAHFDDIEFRVNSFDPDADVPVHEHDWHSLIFVLDGVITVSLDSEHRRLTPGDGVYVASGTRHGLRAVGSGARVVDLWWPMGRKS